MDQTFLVQSMIVGGAIFLGLVVFWFIHVYLRKHVAPKPAASRWLAGSWEERRQHQRMPVNWPACMKTSGGCIRATLQDISLGGAFVVCQNPLPLKHRFNLRIDAPDFDALSLNSEVVWSNVNVPDDKVVNRGMGVRFVHNPEAELERLRQIIAAIKNQPLQ